MKTGGLFICFLLLGFAGSIRAQDATVPVLIDYRLVPDGMHWKYHPGDHPDWKRSDFDDHTWERLARPTFSPDGIPDSGWNGIGWFRLRFEIDSTLVNQPLGFVVYTLGALELYLDDELLTALGRVGTSVDDEVSISSSPPNPHLVAFSFKRAGTHVVAVRYSNFYASNFHRIGSRFVGLMIAMAVYLARHVSGTNRKLTEQLEQVRLLSAKTLDIRAYGHSEK